MQILPPVPASGAKLHLDRQRNPETFGPDATPQRLLAGDVDMLDH